jgi:hypothetical protein
MRHASLAVLSLTTALAAISACSSSDHADAPAAAGVVDALDGSTSVLPVETSPPSVYVAKVKNVLVGLAPTDDEVKAVEADPTKLASLIDAWMKLPEYQTKMLRFFELAFQQTQVDETDFDEQTSPARISINGKATALLVQNATESFARTVLALTQQGRPLTDAMTTRSFMMTPALMELYAFLDAWQVDDAGKVTDRFKAAYPTATVIVSGAAPIPLADSVNPASPNFLHFYNPDLATLEAKTPGCFADPVVYPAPRAVTVHYTLLGSLDNGRKSTINGVACPPAGLASVTQQQIAGDDFTTWKMVSIRTPKAGETPTPFFDLPALRAASQLVLKVPRVGFFSTPAFFANWQTNTSNQMRVTVNQTLIVGLGAAVDGTDATHPATTPGLDAAHASAPECFACHQTLDPTRSVFASAFSWSYHNQTEAPFASQPGMFAFQGVTKPVATLEDFGNTLATHPLFAQAWVQKLCYYANSRKCDAADPELQRIVDLFKTSGFAWNTLVRELLASPITTNATVTQTLSDEGEVIAVSRRDHLCAALGGRLGIADICGLKSTPVAAGKAKAALATINQIVSGLPSDGYGRGSVAPVLPNDPSLFYRAATENICEAVAELVIDPAAPLPGAKQWSSAMPDAVIAELVPAIMALTSSDPRSAPALGALQGHFAAAVKAGATPSDALKSTFVVACLAPSSISVGL